MSPLWPCLALVGLLAGPAAAEGAPFLSGERVTLKITYAHLLAGRAELSVAPAVHDGAPSLQLVATARSEGFFAWLFRFKVSDRTVAWWDPASGCSLGIEKALREGRAARDQVVRLDPAGKALVRDAKIAAERFDVEPCSLDILSAFFVTRLRGVPEQGTLALPVFDNGKRYQLGVRFVERERLDLPAPLGKDTPVVVIEPQLIEGTGLFVKDRKARLLIWLTDDARRVPVRMRSKVAIGWVSADLERYEPGHDHPDARGSAAEPRQ